MEEWTRALPPLPPDAQVSFEGSRPGGGWKIGEIEEGPGLRLPGVPSGGAPPGLDGFPLDGPLQVSPLGWTAEHLATLEPPTPAEQQAELRVASGDGFT